jgi:hypothetical protein
MRWFVKATVEGNWWSACACQAGQSETDERGSWPCTKLMPDWAAICQENGNPLPMGRPDLRGATRAAGPRVMCPL